MKNILTGKNAEDKVCVYITNCGMTVITRNYRTLRGEIDIIALDDGVITFIEVKKMPASWDICDINRKINARKKNCIKQSAAYFLANCCEVKYSDIRFDVAVVVSDFITYYKEAF